MAEYKVITAACLCGRNAYTTSVAKASLPLKASICHCYGCRHVSGTLGSPSCDWPASTIPNLTGLSRFDFSPRVWTYFCGTCGTYLFWHHHSQNDFPNSNDHNYIGDTVRFAVNVGVLDKPDDIVEIVQHICVLGTRDGGWADFLPVIDNRPLPRWKRLSQSAPKDLTELLPVGWRLQAKTDDQEPEKILKAHCLCRGVEFYITRPSTVQVPGVKEGDEWWQASGDRFPAGCCVCLYCRLAAGADVMHWSYIPKTNIKLMDGSDFSTTNFGTVKSYRSSDEASREFCSQCGCSIFYSADGRPGLLDVSVGLFCASSGARAEDWLAWRAWKISWENDAVHTRLRDGIRSGIKSWGEKQPDGSFQNIGREPSLVAFKKLLAATNCDG